MARQLKRWESPRQEGRNTKGKGGSARQRQRRKQLQMLRQKLKDASPQPDSPKPDSPKPDATNPILQEAAAMHLLIFFAPNSFEPRRDRPAAARMPSSL